MSYGRKGAPGAPPTAEDLRERVAERMRKLRRAQKLTVEQAAEAAGLDPRKWRKLEAGESNATLSTLACVAAALEVRMVELFRRPGRQRKPR